LRVATREPTRTTIGSIADHVDAALAATQLAARTQSAGTACARPPTPTGYAHVSCGARHTATSAVVAIVGDVDAGATATTVARGAVEATGVRPVRAIGNVAHIFDVFDVLHV
jgi:hypothetical protein